MAFPQVANLAASSEIGNVTSHTVDLPANIEVGDLLLLFFTIDGSSNNITNWNGFKELIEIGGTQSLSYVACKRADGSEGATVAITSSNLEQSAHQCLRITGAADVSIRLPEVSVGVNATGTNPNPDSLTASFGAMEILWFAVAGSGGTETVSVYPLPDNNVHEDGSGGGGCEISICSDDLNQATLDPSTFTMAASQAWCACTVAIYPESETAEFRGLRLDDYSSADQIDVYCDGYVLRVPKIHTVQSEHIIVYDPSDVGGTILWHDLCESFDGSNYYFLCYDSNRTIEIIENTSARVRIRIKGNLDRTSGATNDYLSNSTSVTIIYTIYPDRYTTEWEWVVSGTVTVNKAYFTGPDERNLTNANSIYENAGSESDCADSTAYDSADYLAVISDEMNIMMIKLSDPSDTFDHQYNSSDGNIRRRRDTDLTVGAYVGSNLCIIDSADRTNGKKYSLEADRIGLGNQYKDYTIAALTKGTKVTDLNYPDIVGADCFAADAARHVEPSSNRELILPWDITRKRPVLELRDYPFLSGSTPDDHLLNFLKLEDNAASSVLLAAVGDNANWENVSDGSNRNTNTSGDSVDAVRGKGLDTQDGAGYIDMDLTDHDNVFLKKGSIIIKFKPQFSWNDAARQTIFKLRYAATDFVSVHYDEGLNRFELTIELGDVAREIATPAYTSATEKELQQWHVALFSWNYDQDFMCFVLDGNVIGTNYNGWTSVTSNAPITFHIGCKEDRGIPADIIIDEIKTFNDCILPYGSIFLGNNEIDVNLADPDVCFHWDCENSGANASNIPSDKTITLNGSAALVTTDPIYGSKHLDTVNADDDASVPIVNYDIIDPRHGSIGFWLNVQTLPGTIKYLFGYGDTNNYIQIGLNASNYARLYYLANSVGVSVNGSAALVADKWYYFSVKFSDSNNEGFIELWVNNVFLGGIAVANAFNYASGTLYFGVNYLNTGGVDCFMDQITISKSIVTPQNWSAFGKPLWRPLIQVS